ncbi:signal peptidase 22 kDa subunit [Pseudovirgaria hyperparasitica]|uniref:Signal peptidase subunit 3 n=1 Tax=Pseudovirgaria hyperparasitica TaxID=470096 RepID=A0A6A6VYG7_9PEZI|nr:signal peptidase 22 kDa subunit [Pseudovirgaria hyperparasitica]KAF2754764.1 signal peptidase 22 kDa subunit [Pseudovirgaria hyperparasitica]
MHSTLVRGQNVFGFFTTVAFCVAGIIAASVFLIPQAPSASLQLRNVQVVKGRPHYYSPKREEYAHIKFDLDADLTTLFNWNTKQVFLYITATYPSLRASEPASSAIIWDAIIPSSSAPWHTNHYIHPVAPSDKSATTKGKKNSSKSKKAAKKSAYPAGELHLKNQRPKYQITDYAGRIANRTDAVLELHYNVQPWVGLLLWDRRSDIAMWKGLEGGRSELFNFPGLKGAAAKKEDLKTEKGAEGHRLMAG